MARVTHVKKAQQRYATKPVLDENGQPVRTPVMRNGHQKVTKKGRPVFITKTVADKTKPLPNLRCDFPGCTIDGGEILPGTAYKWIKPKSGPYGGHLKARHEQHPTWQVWDYSSSLSAQVARIEHVATAAVASVDTPEDAQAILEQAAQEIRDLAEQKREGASNIEEGFGHATYQSEELEQQADDLDSWADDVEGADLPDLDDYVDTECPECAGSGTVETDCERCDGTGETQESDETDEPDTCEDCAGSGTVEAECSECVGTGEVDADESGLDEWRDAVAEAVSEALANCPV